MAKQKRTCTFDGCDRPNFAHGLCAAHAAQKRRGVELRTIRPPKPKAEEGYSWCGKCRQFRPVEQFGWDKKRDQIARACDPCRAEYMREYNARNRDQIRLRSTLKSWGLTEDQYRALFDAQDHCCAICGAERREWRSLAIDHDHQTGRIRGLLCQDCNLGAGQFADDPDLLEAAARYLRAGGVVHDESLRVPDDSPHAKRSRERDTARARMRG